MKNSRTIARPATVPSAAPHTECTHDASPPPTISLNIPTETEREIPVSRPHLAPNMKVKGAREEVTLAGCRGGVSFSHPRSVLYSSPAREMRNDSSISHFVALCARDGSARYLSRARERVAHHRGINKASPTPPRARASLFFLGSRISLGATVRRWPREKIFFFFSRVFFFCAGAEKFFCCGGSSSSSGTLVCTGGFGGERRKKSREMVLIARWVLGNEDGRAAPRRRWRICVFVYAARYY